MSEGFNEENPVTRGRRDPEIAAMLEAENDLNQPGDPNEQDTVYIGLFPGDMTMVKVTLFAKTPMGDAWFTAGTQSRVADGETAEDAFDRVTDVITAEVMKFGDKQLDVITTVQGELESAPPRHRGRITPR